MGYKIKHLRRASYIRADFPFTIQHMVHKYGHFHMEERFQRDFWKITYIIKGNGRMILNDSSYPVSSGSLLLVHPDSLTTFEIDSPFLEIYNIIFLPEFIETELRGLRDNFHFFSIFSGDFRQDSCAKCYILEADVKIKNLLSGMEKEFSNEKSNYKILLKIQFAELIVRLLRCSEQRRRSFDHSQVGGYITHLLESHFNEEFHLDDIASALGMSKSHICRIYKKQYSKTIVGTLKDLRLDYSMKQILESSDSISEICYKSGFNDLSYFYKAFEQKFKNGPGFFRKQR